MMHSVIPLHHPARLRRRVPRRAVAAALLPLVGLAGAAQAQERPLPQTVGGNSALRQQRSAEYAALMQAQRYQMMLDRLIQQNLREVVNPPMVPFASLMLNDEARDEAIQARLSRMGGRCSTAK
jgi:parvulin-like peptidyl-prolyl isomerase